MVRLKLVARLLEVSELLASPPGLDLETIRKGVREIRTLHRSSPGEGGVLGLVLHNLARDLSGAEAQLDGAYYSRQLSAAAEAIGAP